MLAAEPGPPPRPRGLRSSTSTAVISSGGPGILAGHDGALDGYAYMLEELAVTDCQRLRKYAADGRGRFSTWLAVVGGGCASINTVGATDGSAATRPARGRQAAR